MYHYSTEFSSVLIQFSSITEKFNCKHFYRLGNGKWLCSGRQKTLFYDDVAKVLNYESAIKQLCRYFTFCSYSKVSVQSNWIWKWTFL